MLIDEIMSFCDSEYKKAHKNTRCENCMHVGDCPGNCKKCLEEIHYLSRNPDGKKFYDCPNLINFYVCDYTYKYTVEIYRLLQKSAVLKRINHYNIFSIGCGACPDLMAFEIYLKKSVSNKTLEYRGIDKNQLWNPIHSQIIGYKTDEFVSTRLDIEDVFDFLEKFVVGEVNVLVLQYIISALYSSGGPKVVEKLFDLIVDNIVKAKKESEPFVILINDVNSINMGRDLFVSLATKIELIGLKVNCTKYYFERNIKVEAQRYGNKQENSDAMNEKLVERYKQYEPWEFCTSAQLLIEIGESDE